MSKRPFDTLQPKITRNDRFAQMSHQEKIIEQKKKEIQAKLEAKQKATGDTNDKAKAEKTTAEKPTKPPDTAELEDKNSGFNAFSNDGSFLNQFKQLKERKFESKLKSFNKSREEKNYSDDRNKKWSQKHSPPSPRDRSRRQSRFSSEKVPNFEQKITINTSFSISNPTIQPVPPPQQTFENLPIQHPQQQPLVPQHFPTQNVISVPPVSYAPSNVAPNICEQAAPTVLLNVPPPPIVQGQMNNSIVLSQPQNVLVSAPLQQVSAVLTTVTLPPPMLAAAPAIQNAVPVPPPCLPTVELASIPPPNPIQVQNIPQPDPINTMNIPPPAPLQVHNIPTPHSIQLNEIPNPKPLDLMAIPTPNEDNGISDPDFIKNIPPPNKSVPPPNMSNQEVQLPNVSLLRPPQANLGVAQGILLQNNQIQAVPPPQQSFNPVLSAATLVQAPPSQIPSLMATPILPPPGISVSGVNVNCPPPIMPPNNPNPMLTQQPPPFVGPPPVGGQMPPMNVPPPMVGSGLVGGFKDANAVFPAGTAAFEAMSSLARMVADCGPRIEDVVRQKKTQDPALWFLFRKDSAAHRQYLALVEQYRRENEFEDETKPNMEDVYEPEMALEDDFSDGGTVKMEYDEKLDICGLNEKRRKRKSRWGEKDTNVPPPAVVASNIPQTSNQPMPMLSKVTRSDPGLVQYAMNAYGSANLSEEDWKKAEDNYKIHLLYQDMMRKREEVQRLQMQGKNKYEYDSDEDTDGGTWEHRLREKEMMATELWAQELNRQAEGKHHIGDFLPPDELKRFMENSNAVKEGRLPNFSDYKEFKIKEDNIGFKMLQKLGWTEGQGLGSQGTGIVEPVNKGAPREHTQGLGLNLSETMEGEDEYESYRKRMMLAYRFRPNPLNNPRRPYY